MEPRSRLRRSLETARPELFSAFCIAAAFGTYFCMYAFRKPFSAGTYEGLSLWGTNYKAILVASQLAGYTISKFAGIRIVSEMPAGRRVVTILALITFAEVALIGFALVPAPYNFGFLFLNGLPLGMVFGLVLAFLEGRRVTEALAAGLCASFIVAGGVVKSVGRWLIETHGVSEFWMPSLVGAVFVPPLLVSVWMLGQIPPPNREDIALRSERVPMDRAQRRTFLRRHALGLTGLLLAYVLLTVMRTLRDDFAVEIWSELGVSGEPSVFARSETLVMLGVVAVNGAAIRIRSHRLALLGSLGIVAGGFGIVLLAFWGSSAGWLSPFAFMVLSGFGMYVPYVAFHTTIFERLLAAVREPGNLGFLMYVADATGYLGVVGVLVVKSWSSGAEIEFLPLFTTLSLIIGVVTIGLMLALVVHYRRRLPQEASDA